VRRRQSGRRMAEGGVAGAGGLERHDVAGVRYERLEEVFHEALQRGAGERSAYLDTACGSDLELRTRVETLLRAHESAGDFLESPVATTEAALLGAAASEQPGTRIGRYKLLQLIGEGGFGAVYMAEQEEPVHRKVAVKIIKLGMDTKQVIARFEAERQALALMEHPHIARVFDAGATETGRPYFVMELVRGTPITEFCDHQRLNTPERLRLFVQVCQAVQHAHQKGIIHRDIKPGNVLVTMHDDRPVPKVIDFGIAKATSQRLTERTLFTEFRQFIGTPEYMSPDQAEVRGLDVDTRTDVYSLGVLLYVLLTGTTPVDGRTLRGAEVGELRRMIREVEPPRPSARLHTLSRTEQGSRIAGRRQCEPAALSRLLHGDLDWIVMKALEKDRTRRYQTVHELAEDIERHLRHEPVSAGPPSLRYRLVKFVRRNRVAVVTSASVLATLVGGLVTTTYFYIAAARERDTARAAQARADSEAQRSERIADVLQDLFVSTSPDQALERDVDVEQGLAAALTAFGPDDAAVAATLGSRALQLRSAGDREGAERLYREALRIWREQSGPSDLNVAATLRELGSLQATKGDLQAAELTYRECLRITRARPGPATLTQAETLAQLAGVLSNEGQYDEAATLLREALAIRQEVAPTQRLQYAITASALVNALALAGQDKELAPAMDTLLAAWRAALPPDSPSLATLLTQSARIQIDRGNVDTAEALLREALEIYQTPGNVAAAHHVSALDLLQTVLERRKNPAGILPVARRGFDVAKEVGNRAAIRDVGMCMANGCWIVARNRSRPPAEYETAFTDVTAYLAEVPDEYRVVNTLGVLQYRLGQYAEAVATLERCDQHNKEKHEFGLPTDTAFLALAHAKLGQFDEARAALGRMRQAMETEAFAGDADARRAASEAEAQLGMPGAPLDAMAP